MFLLIFRERRRKRCRKIDVTEIHQSVASCTPHDQGSDPQPRYVPQVGSNPQPLGAHDDILTKPSSQGRLSMLLMTLTVLRSTGQVFCWMSLNLNLSNVFLMIRLEFWTFGKKTTEVNLSFHYITPKKHTINMTSPGWGSVCQVSPL